MHFGMHTLAATRRLFRRKPRAEGLDEDYEEDEEDWEQPQPVVDAHGRIEPSFGPAPLVDYDDDEDEDFEDETIRTTGSRVSSRRRRSGRSGIRAFTPNIPIRLTIRRR
ncbi:hypothetical protein [Methyloceanibacter marginalis]|nr:hypothetical protein [Methyloceanibacter marginalis]